MVYDKYSGINSPITGRWTLYLFSDTASGISSGNCCPVYINAKIYEFNSQQRFELSAISSGYLCLKSPKEDKTGHMSPGGLRDWIEWTEKRILCLLVRPASIFTKPSYLDRLCVFFLLPTFQTSVIKNFYEILLVFHLHIYLFYSYSAAPI